MEILTQHSVKTARLYSLDYLRGLAALGIMIYHYAMWTLGPQDSGDIIGRIGIYGVPIFYILSGLTLFEVYKEKMNTTDDTIRFFINRVFRIFPLLWLATIGTIVLMNIDLSSKVVLLNFTGLFGFVAWDEGLATGVWSIGNELVFYAMFPFLILAWKKKLIIIPFFILLGFYIWFAFFKIDPSQTLALQWKDYVNPLNQGFLFVAGFMIGIIRPRLKWDAALYILLMALTIFCIMPSRGDHVMIVTEWERLLYTAVCITVVVCFYSLQFKVPVVHGLLSGLGEASYSVYLLHPLIWMLVGRFILGVPQVIIAFPLTLIISHLVYRYFEKTFIKIGKSVMVRSAKSVKYLLVAVLISFLVYCNGEGSNHPVRPPGSDTLRVDTLRVDSTKK